MNLRWPQSVGKNSGAPMDGLSASPWMARWCQGAFTLRWVFVLLLLIAQPAWLRAQAISTVIVSGPRVIVTAGEQIQLQALARDNQGNRVTNDVWQWSSSNPAAVAVDSSGVVSANGVGLANITVRAGAAVSPAVQLQVLPSRIDVWPERNEVIVGQPLQFHAVAFDIYDQPIRDTRFVWSITGSNGFTTRGAQIDNQGLLVASGIGLLTVHAAVLFTGQSAAHVARFEGMSHVRVKTRQEYKLTRLLASDPLERTFELRAGYMSEIAVNDAGQIAFVANLEGLSSALMLYEDGKFQVLASAATPGPGPASYIYHFDAPPSINNNGEILVRYVSFGASGLMLASKTQVTLLPEGVSLGTMERMNFFRASRYSLNDKGEFIFLANYTQRGRRTSNTGLFQAVGGSIFLIWSNADPVPGFPADYNFDSREFGSTGSGQVYFTVQSGSNRAIYKAQIGESPVKIVGQGTMLNGLQVQTVTRLGLSANANLAFTFVLADGTQGLAHIQSGGTQPRFQMLRSAGSILGVSNSGDVFYTGDPGWEPWWGMWRWPSQGQPVQVTAWGTRFDGNAFNWTRSGAITSTGQLYADVYTPENDLVVVRPDSGQVLFKGGSRIDAQVGLNFLGLVPGATTGPVHVFAGSANAALMEATRNGLKPVWIPGDRFPLGAPTNFMTRSATMAFAAKDPSGTLYVALGDGIIKVQENRPERIVALPMEFRNERVPVTIAGHAGWYAGSLALAINRYGSFAWNASAGSHNRLFLYSQGRLAPIMIQGGSEQTNSSAGGRFAAIAGGTWHQNTVAIDDSGSVFVNALVTGGPSGLFLYENNQWKAAALFGATRIDGATVTGARAIQSGDRRFYALLDLTSGGAIAEYDGQEWKVLVRRTDLTPDGIEIGFFSNLFSANGRGDLAFLATGSRGRIVTRSADGKLRIVYSGLDVTDSGDMLWPFSYMSLQLHDDGRLFIVGLDTFDRNTLYVAEPLP